MNPFPLRPPRPHWGRWLVLGALASGLPGCLVYPRLARVYDTPAYDGLFLDQCDRPVPHVAIALAGRRGPLGDTTGADGRARLRPQRHFQVLGALVLYMEPPRPLALHVRPAKGPARMHDLPFPYDRRHLTSIADTVRLVVPE